MADRKISDLTALTTPASGDFLPIVDISEAALDTKNKRITIQSLFQGIPVDVGIGSGRLLVGTSSARGNFKINVTLYDAGQQLEAGSQGFQSFVGGFASPGGPYLMLAHQRSGFVGGNTVLVNGDEMGTVSFHGADGTNLVIGAAIKGEVDGTPGANDMPGRLVFSTTADGATSPTERMRIKSNGTINFSNVATYADNTAATAAGLAVGDVYKTVLGVLMIRF